MPDVVCLGALLIDFVSTAKGVALRDAPGFAKKPGGAPANVAAGLARLGRRAGFVGKVGADAFGEFLAGVLDEVGVDTSRLLRDSSVPTTLAFVAVDAHGTPDFSFYRNPGADMMLKPDEIDADYIRSARAFHFDSVGFSASPCREAQLHAAEIAQEAGALISFDVNYRPRLWASESDAREWVRRGLEICHFAKVSEEEWEFVTGTADLRRGAHGILSQGVRLLAISRGENGCAYTNGAHWGEVAGLEVEVAETTGAGDAFLAAALDGLLYECRTPDEIAALSGETLKRIFARANRAGAITCTKVGAIPALPSGAELDKE